MTDASRALTVTEAMTLAKRTLEGVPLRVMGEVSEYTDRSGYKAVYFTLSDGGSVMPCLMWRDVFASSGVPLHEGMMVEVTGALTVYPPKGRMQFQVRGLAAAGEGALRLKVAAVARKLEAEGLMRPERRRPLPEFPDRVALVTSPRGKAVHDVIRTLRRRYPAAELVIAGVAVEGARAVESIVEGLVAAGSSGADVVILARGGGSYEDLMPFNDEAVARAVVACPVPVVTGIGHEPDTSIADMVADVRASTPTAAAEAVAPSCDEVSARLRAMQRLLGRGLLHAARDAERRVAVVRAHAVFRDPRALTATAAQRLDAAAAGLPRALPAHTRRDREHLRLTTGALRRAVGLSLERSGDRIGRGAARLHDLSPLGILGRGYAVCYAEDGRTVVRSTATIAPGNRVRVRLHDGAAGCVVESIEREEV
jgi:exodeoxyribonuclease VII large subunit